MPPTTTRSPRGIDRLFLALVVALVCAGCAASSQGGVAPLQGSYAGRASASSAIASLPSRFFSSNSFWNTPVEAGAAIDPQSGPIIEAFDNEIAADLASHHGPGISTTSYSVPIYTVSRRQPTVRVKLVSKQPAPALQAAWKHVPLPTRAQPSAGSDHTLVVWQPSTDRLWEFWRFQRSGNGWQASWGGAMRKVSSNPGVYGPSAWPDAKPWWGSSASSLSIIGGLITFKDLQQGVINHALAIAIPHARAGVYSLPARRSDGESASPVALPEGAHLRLDPNLDLSSISMPPITRIIANAAQRYGIFVRDGAGVAHFFAQDPVTLGSDPYAGTEGFFEGKYPGQLLVSFPWNHLQLLQMHLRRYYGRRGTG